MVSILSRYSGAEKDNVGMMIRSGPRGQVPAIASAFFMGATGVTEDQQWYYEFGHEEATPTRSFYLFFRALPTKFAFGHEGQQLFICVPSIIEEMT